MSPRPLAEDVRCGSRPLPAGVCSTSSGTSPLSCRREAWRSHPEPHLHYAKAHPGRLETGEPNPFGFNHQATSQEIHLGFFFSFCRKEKKNPPGLANPVHLYMLGLHTFVFWQMGTILDNKVKP